MTKDFMTRDTMMSYTAYDIGCGCYTSKHERQFKKMFKRAARRNAKKALDKQFGM
jgi:hypothetical protein